MVNEGNAAGALKLGGQGGVEQGRDMEVKNARGGGGEGEGYLLRSQYRARRQKQLKFDGRLDLMLR